MSIAENIKKIKNSIQDNATLVAAVKYASNEQILELVKGGVKDFGFNTYQQLRQVKALLPSDARIHFIGHLQSNKVRKVLQENVFLIQSVDSYKLTEKIDRVANELGIKQDILLEVKTDETKKHGFSALETENIVLEINNSLKNIKIKGLMTIPPLSANPHDSRRYFSLIKELFDKLSEKKNKKLEYLSMGMSDDYKAAIEEGSNMVRIGRALFR
ncbi:MAG: YggS family pyridoxal phosphate-dependent enzyme [Nanoarchaeota archaeon]